MDRSLIVKLQNETAGCNKNLTTFGSNPPDFKNTTRQKKG